MFARVERMTLGVGDKEEIRKQKDWAVSCEMDEPSRVELKSSRVEPG